MCACRPRRRASRTRSAAALESFQAVDPPTKTAARDAAPQGTIPGLRSRPAARTPAADAKATHATRGTARASACCHLSARSRGLCSCRRTVSRRRSGTARRRARPPTEARSVFGERRVVEHDRASRAAGRAECPRVAGGRARPRLADPRADGRPRHHTAEHPADTIDVEASERPTVDRAGHPGRQRLVNPRPARGDEQPSEVGVAVLLDRRVRRGVQQQHAASAVRGHRCRLAAAELSGQSACRPSGSVIAAAVSASCAIAARNSALQPFWL